MAGRCCRDSLLRCKRKPALPCNCSLARLMYHNMQTQWLQEYEADPNWKDVPPSFRHLTPRELATFPDSTWKHGWKWTTVITDMQMYMHYLMQRFIQVQ